LQIRSTYRARNGADDQAFVEAHVYF